MTPDDIDSIDARIREVCEQDDALRAERKAAQRCAGAPPMRENGADGVLHREQENNALQTTPVAYTPTEEPSGGFFVNREALVETLGEIISDLRAEIEQAFAPLQEEIIALRTEMRGRVKGLIELRGAFHIRGPYHEDQRYQALDVVTVDDRWYAARSDRPGPCPGPNWEPGPAGCQGAKGLRGSRGPRGEQGAAGTDAPKFMSWDIDRANYRAVAKMSDGSEMTLDLYPMFERFVAETGE